MGLRGGSRGSSGLQSGGLLEDTQPSTRDGDDTFEFPSARARSQDLDHDQDIAGSNQGEGGWGVKLGSRGSIRRARQLQPPQQPPLEQPSQYGSRAQQRDQLDQAPASEPACVITSGMGVLRVHKLRWQAPVAHVACGAAHTVVALAQKGGVWAWGSNSHGQVRVVSSTILCVGLHVICIVCFCSANLWVHLDGICQPLWLLQSQRLQALWGLSSLTCLE